MNALLPLILWLLLGVPATLPFWRRRQWDLALGLLPFAGALALVVPWLVSALTGLSVAGWLWGGEALLASAVLAVPVELLVRRNDAALSSPPRPADAGAATWGITIISLGVLLFVGIDCVITGTGLSQGDPGYGWDAYAMWLVRTKVLADCGAFPREIYLPDANPDYPLLLPAILGWFRRVGNFQIHELQTPIGLVAMVFPLAAWTTLRRRIGPAMAAAAALAPLAAFQLVIYQFNAYADPTVAVLCIYGLMLTMIGVRDNDRSFLLAGGIVLAAAVQTKNEAVLWTICCVFAAGLFWLLLGRGWRKAPAALLRVAAPPAAFFLTWSLFCHTMGYSPNVLHNSQLSKAWERLGPTLAAMRDQFTQWQSLALWAPGIVLILVLARGRWHDRLKLLAVLLSAPAIYLAGMAAIYAQARDPLNWLLQTSLLRVTFAVAPAVLAMATLARLPMPAPIGPAAQAKPKLAKVDHD